MLLVSLQSSGETTRKLDSVARRLPAIDSHSSLPAVYVDFYTTYQVRAILGMFQYKQYAITKMRLHLQMLWLNHWYHGRIQFRMGSFFETQEEAYHAKEVDCYDLLDIFSEQVKAVDRFNHSISVLIIPSVTNQGCARLGVELGGDAGLLPVAIVGMDAYDLPLLGLQNLFGLAMAHEIGHIFGYQHTVAEQNYVEYYYAPDCNIYNLSYPVWSRDTDDNVLLDNSTGIEYRYEDWKGRTNVMAGASGVASIATMPWQLGLFVNNQARVFGEILRCWIQRSGIATNDTNSEVL